MRFRFCLTDAARRTLRSDSSEMLVLFRSYSHSLVCDDDQFPWKCRRYNVGFKAKFYTSKRARLSRIHTAIKAIMGLVALTALGMDWTEELKTTQ